MARNGQFGRLAKSAGFLQEPAQPRGNCRYRTKKNPN